jgi:hypothetical protein
MPLSLTAFMFVCGIVAALVYVIADALGAVAWSGYSHFSQGVSELMAFGAPSRQLVLSLMTVHAVLLAIFALGVWRSANHNRLLQSAAIFLLVDAVVGWFTPTFFPAMLRGATGSATMHLLLTSVNVLALFLAMGFAVAALRGRFRIYSITTMLVIIVFGFIAGSDAPRIEAGLPTPWLGITERFLIYPYLLWIAALAGILLRRLQQQ